MRRTCLTLGLLGVIAFCLATRLDAWFQGWAGNRAGSANVMTIALGDARRMFANHFFLKADSYFHSGFYPTIYDNREAFKASHAAEGSAAIEGDSEGGGDHSFLGPPKDWIDRFGRNFFPSLHTHLGEQQRASPDDEEAAHAEEPDAGDHSLHAHARSADGAGEPHEDDAPNLERGPRAARPGSEHDEEAKRDGPAHPRESETQTQKHSEPVSGLEREMLPWLRMSSELDPNRVETYAIGAYWLRRMGKPDEAERFLRDGLRANPLDPTILFELGQIHFQTRKDSARARNLWELALKKWDETEPNKAKPNFLLLLQLLGNLAKLEEQASHGEKALSYLTRLKILSPNPDAIQRWIDDLKPML